MKNVVWVGILALLIIAAPAWATGYDAYIDLATATSYTSTCSSAGVDHGRAVPRCVASGDGNFYFPLNIKSNAADALTVAFGPLELVNVSNTTGNMCVAFSCYVVTAGTDITAAMTAATDTSTLSTAIGTTCNAANSVCHTGVTAAVACRDVAQAGDCVGSACTDKQAWGRIKWLTGAGCTSGVSGANNFDMPWLKISVQ